MRYRQVLPSIKNEMKKYIIYILSSLFLFSALPVFAGEEEKEEKSFNPKETIFEHLLDNYSWEVPFSHELKIHLPVIVRDYKGDWKIFSSGKIEKGGSHEGLYIAKEGKNKGKIEGVDDQGNTYRPLDLSITKNVFALIISAFVCAFCVFSVARWYRRNRFKAPRKGSGIMEFVIEMIYRDVIKSTLGDKASRFAPYLLTVFFFILTMNLMGLIVSFPGGANLTGNISITLVLAVCTFIMVNVLGTKGYWKEVFWPDVPTWLKFPVPIMPIIEIFGVFTKPAALMVRLFANMMGGHLIILALISLIFIFGSMGVAVLSGTTVISVLFSLFMMLIDTLVSFIQAYVFTMLSTLFIALAQVKEHQKETR